MTTIHIATNAFTFPNATDTINIIGSNIQANALSNLFANDDGFDLIPSLALHL
jgi:hypothetical protein